MRFYIYSLVLDFRHSTEVVQFSNFNYFFGEMGAGKSSIARLIDYCLGGSLDYTPALQAEFVSASLDLMVGETPLYIQRERNSPQVRVQFQSGDGLIDLTLPARKPKGVVLPETEVEVLSDLLFYLVGISPPRVRRSKLRDDSELQRLSFRDLFWYCYLDQDTLDSEFFNLDPNANFNKRNKSRDVLRFILGFHQERVAELESQLESIRLEKLALFEGARALMSALREADVATENEIVSQTNTLRQNLVEVRSSIQSHRIETEKSRNNAVDVLRNRARSVGFEIAALEDTILSVETIMEEEQQNLNEFSTLSVKVRRDKTARAVLGGVAFIDCPRCTQHLPLRDAAFCPVCGQVEPTMEANIDSDVISADIKVRQSELTDLYTRHKSQVRSLRSRLAEFQELKGSLEGELNTASQLYDSAYLSTTLILEREAITIEERIQYLERLQTLRRRASAQLEQGASLAGREELIKQELSVERAAAENDMYNLRRLERLFLDCLVRAKIPGFSENDTVSISSPYFLPEVTEAGARDLVVNSFANLGSGGKKTLFKACFAVAIHRLAREVNALLPTLLIIDSPMKNISERVNREQFEGFHEMMYNLASTELSQTQMILIDKEFLPVPPNIALDITVRHMAPGSTEFLPLISYFGMPDEVEGGKNRAGTNGTIEPSIREPEQN